MNKGPVSFNQRGAGLFRPWSLLKKLGWLT